MKQAVYLRWRANRAERSYYMLNTNELPVDSPGNEYAYIRSLPGGFALKAAEYFQ